MIPKTNPTAATKTTITVHHLVVGINLEVNFNQEVSFSLDTKDQGLECMVHVVRHVFHLDLEGRLQICIDLLICTDHQI